MIFNNANLSIPRLGITAIVGQSGKGKSTLMALCQRLRDPLSGHIFVLGMDVKTTSPVLLRSLVAIVDQDEPLFNRSIIENILVGSTRGTLEKVRETCRLVGLDDFICKELSEGYDTRVGEGGSLLSGGQKQRVNIARALISEAPILILDEVTSALDSQSEKMVLDALVQLSAEKTVVLITHRYEIQSIANTVINI
jgi:ABC-type multidrug transport system fused ATPase/permease subunit